VFVNPFDKAADGLVTARNNSGYGRALSGKAGNYYWGSNGAVARTCMLLQVANRLSPKADYLDTCVDQISRIFGRNYYNRSQVTGVGKDPPLHPHHRPSQADGISNPWPGYLVGGPNPSFSLDSCCTAASGTQAYHCYGSSDYSLCSLSYTPPLGQPSQKAYLQFNSGWPAGSWRAWGDLSRRRSGRNWDGGVPTRLCSSPCAA